MEQLIYFVLRIANHNSQYSYSTSIPNLQLIPAALPCDTSLPCERPSQDPQSSISKLTNKLQYINYELLLLDIFDKPISQPNRRLRS